MFSKLLITSLLSVIPLIGFSANIVINPIAGFSDTTIVSPIGGNSGTTLGAQRLNTFQKAADILGAYLNITIDIQVDAAFNPLTCGPGSAILGSAGATNGKINFANAPNANTIYPIALANNLANSDLNSTSAEINATFNSSIDNNDNCLAGVDWYYGYDDPSTAGIDYTNDTSFLSVVIHELLHGLGMSSWVYSNGALNNGYMDAFSAHLYDQTSAKSWTNMDDRERLASMTNSNNLVWTGSNVNTSSAALALSDGINASQVEMYAPNPYEGGSSVSHFSKDATPNEIMEPSYTEFLTTPGMATQLLQDMGWALASNNTAPVLTAIGDQSSDEDNAKVINLSASDNEGDSLTYSASSNNLSVTATVSGTILTLTPTADYFGDANITVTVSDGSLSDNEVVNYRVNSVNDLPVFTSPTSGTVKYGNSLSVNLAASDIETENNRMTYSVLNVDANQVSASISGATLVLVPVNDYIGSTDLIIRATDDQNGSTDMNFNLTITATTNTPPSFSSNNAYTSLYSAVLDVELSAIDAENDALTFAIANSNNSQIRTTLNGSLLTISGNNNYLGDSIITVSVSDGQEIIHQDIHIRILEDFSLSTPNTQLEDGETSTIDLNTFSFSLAGGNNEHTVSIKFDGQAIENSLLTKVNRTYQLAMPTEGAFAGSYEVTVSDSSGETARFTLQRPLRLSSNISQLISNSKLQELFIEGAPAGKMIDLHIAQVNNNLILQLNDETITQVTSPDNAELFNRATVQLHLLDISENNNAIIRADGIGLPIASHTLELIPLKTLTLNITDSTMMAVTARIVINDDRFLIWGLTQQHETNANGEASFSLPADQTTSLTVSAEHYKVKNFEIARDISQRAIELELLENPMTVSGIITTRTLNFESESPNVQLIATDGTIAQAALTNIVSKSVNYSITVNKYKFYADQLSITHGDIRQDIPLSDTNSHSIINIQIDQLQEVNSEDQENDPAEDVVDVGSASGSGFAILLCTLILLRFRQNRTRQQITTTLI